MDLRSKYVPYEGPFNTITERVSEMTPREADIWRRNLMKWIDKNHPHMGEREAFRDLVDQANYWRNAFWELMWHEHSSYKQLVDLYHATLARLKELEHGE